MIVAMNKQPRHKPNISLVIAGAVLLALVALTILLWQPAADLFTDPSRARALVAESGPWGPVIFILLQIAQVLVAPIPGQITGALGGVLFGSLLGTLYGMIGAAIGFTLIFILARKLGRPFVEYFVDPKLLKKFDYISQKNGTLVLFLIFLLPAFPDDIICYAAGLTAIRIRTLVLISVLGRLPGYFLLSLTGSGVAESNAILVAVVVGVLAAIGVVGLWQRKRIHDWVKNLASPHKDNTKDK